MTTRNYFDTPEEFLRSDNSYLVVRHNSSNVFSKAFWRYADAANLNHSFAGVEGNQRESYEDGVKIGWEMAMRKSQVNGNNPNPVGLSKQEFSDVMFILNALGIQFTYMNEPPRFIREHIKYSENSFHPGLNICKNVDAINAGVTVNSVVKDRIIEILKNNTPEYMWPKTFDS